MAGQPTKDMVMMGHIPGKSMRGIPGKSMRGGRPLGTPDRQPRLARLDKARGAAPQVGTAGGGMVADRARMNQDLQRKAQLQNDFKKRLKDMGMMGQIPGPSDMISKNFQPVFQGLAEQGVTNRKDIKRSWNVPGGPRQPQKPLGFGGY